MGPTTRHHWRARLLYPFGVGVRQSAPHRKGADSSWWTARPGWLLLRSEQLPGAERDDAAPGDDHVIEHGDPDELSDLDEPLGDRQVFLARFRVAAYAKLKLDMSLRSGDFEVRTVADRSPFAFIHRSRTAQTLT